MTFVLHSFINSSECLRCAVSSGSLWSGGEVAFLVWQVVGTVLMAAEEKQC